MKINQDELKLIQVFLVYYCNLSCEYCYQDFSKLDIKKMSLLVFKDILKKIENEKNIDLNLFWWEPLLNKEIMDYILSSSFNINDNIKVLSINTNGLLLDKRIIDFAFQNKEVVRIDISIDWNREIHDYYRKNNLWDWSYSVIENNLKNVKDFSNYNVNFCVAPFASNKLREWIENLVNLGFTDIKIMFLYEKIWSREDLKNLLIELIFLRKYIWIININIFNFYKDTWEECRKDFLTSFTFLPSWENILCPVWISKQSDKVIEQKPFFLNSLNEKIEIVNEKVFWNEKLNSIIEKWPICEWIQGALFMKNKITIELLITKVYKLWLNIK